MANSGTKSLVKNSISNFSSGDDASAVLSPALQVPVSGMSDCQTKQAKQTTIRHGGQQFFVADVRAREVVRVPTLEALNSTIQSFERRTGAIFCTFKSSNNFGNIPKRNMLNEHRIRWESRQDTKYSAQLSFDGFPYVWLASRLYRCNRFGNPSKLKSGTRSLPTAFSASTKPGSNCRPCLCPAAIHVAQLVRFPAYKVESNDVKRKERTTERLIRDWRDPLTNCIAEQQFVISVPPVSDHNHTLTSVNVADASMSDSVSTPTCSAALAYTKTDPRVIMHIHRLYRSGVRTLREMKQRVREIIARDFANEAINGTDARFFLSDKNICNNMYRAKLQLLAERASKPPRQNHPPTSTDMEAEGAGVSSSHLTKDLLVLENDPVIIDLS